MAAFLVGLGTWDDRGNHGLAHVRVLASVGQVRVHHFEHLRQRAVRLHRTTQVEDCDLIANCIKGDELDEQPRRDDLCDASFMPGLLNACHCSCKRLRTVVSIVYGGRPSRPEPG